MPARAAYRALEAIRPRLPAVRNQPDHYERVPNLLALAERFDVFCFDAFGVLNVGQTAIPNAIATVAELRRRGKRLFVVSNASAVARPGLVERYRRLGYDFTAEEIVSSRDALLANFSPDPAKTYGLIGLREGQEDLAGLRLVYQDEADFYARADEILFLSSLNWDDHRQERFLAEMAAWPRPVYLGNPDLIAPQGAATSIEAGTYVLLPEALQPLVRVYGKPWPAIFTEMARRLDRFNPARTLMLGDTLHTDILGANHFGIGSALVSDWGFFKGLDWAAAIADSGIVPHYVLPAL